MLINFREFHEVFTNMSKPLLICSLLPVIEESRLLFRYFISILSKPFFDMFVTSSYISKLNVHILFENFLVVK